MPFDITGILMTFNLPAGDLCAAKFSDGEWYRAKVEKVAGSQVRRFFKKRVNELTSNFFYRLLNFYFLFRFLFLFYLFSKLLRLYLLLFSFLSNLLLFLFDSLHLILELFSPLFVFLLR